MGSRLGQSKCSECCDLVQASTNISAFPSEGNGAEPIWSRWPKPNGLSNAATAPGSRRLRWESGMRGWVGRTDCSEAHQRCPPLPLRPARVSPVHMPYAVLNWTLGVCAEHRAALAERRCRARRTARASLRRSLRGGGENSGVESLVLWFCSTSGRTVERARSVPSVKGTAASCRQHSRGSGAGELPDALAHFTWGFVVLLL
ncbi:uncharacterized protein LOC121347931 [Onychostruthus taczanowskii]|uniref:uncharacterized protein LOC121347931 n=1 Tax=Onychostruthus taczanowskii TaxID=356909 RepID=UPI001B8052CE|nr:uncharacterized protein LOC121347931 [Onychostruthus taczanowskii]